MTGLLINVKAICLLERPPDLSSVYTGMERVNSQREIATCRRTGSHSHVLAKANPVHPRRLSNGEGVPVSGLSCNRGPV